MFPLFWEAVITEKNENVYKFDFFYLRVKFNNSNYLDFVSKIFGVRLMARFILKGEFEFMEV